MKRIIILRSRFHSRFCRALRSPPGYHHRDQFFAKVSDRYSTIDDYEAAIVISSASQPMAGKLYFKSPLSCASISANRGAGHRVRRERLVVYIPQYRAVLQQETGTAGLGAGAASLASREGLVMMKRNYTIAWRLPPRRFPSTKAPRRWCTSCSSRKTVSEGFKTVRISISESSLLIRRIEGWTVANERIAFDFTSVKLNQNIPAARFLYDAPASANVYNNFLFQ